MKPHEIWTIGHSTRSLDEFLGLLRSAGIQLVADVRRFPGSRRFPHFGGAQLAAALRDCGIGYMHFPELGGRRNPRPDSKNTAWRVAAFRGYADYMETPEFKQGMSRLTTQAETLRTAILCAEALWWQCHRGLISDYLKINSWIVHHINSNGKDEVHPFTKAAHIAGGKLTYSSGPPSEGELLFSL